ncbi:single-stranded DNA-binding protein [Limosilactobacillus reuteri]|uniref:Single-stranded DNA-binding protein n=1 Tax=Limosilactobacillus reuteri TaxID=1598 RepID=A0A1C2G9J1_LIMRT|nr:ERF family protein [Limosilactobacillus reuteri]AXX75116.1 single-stranded DNA-binding protein [Limosilactobacillus reuteri]MCC4344748.1 ERF family protein [Limosilactobacillus reuteri]OCX48178.1 single-stranded DNA-binding protein [Limosilactobacillus reuteri]WJK31532.1 ERF family protein [Limosilactobacillus reuteri]WPC93117.1 ERF family protein [Limosilactobacillus reuteri]
MVEAVETPKEKRENLSLAEKLNRAIADIGPVKKDGSNNYQNYRFQSEAAIKAAVKKAMSLNGFSIIPKYEVLHQRDVPGRKGNNHIVDVMGTFTITDGRKDQEIVGQMPGSGMDTGEKAMAKACTSAQKYFYKQLFNISDQDDDPDATDSDVGTPTNYQQQSAYPQQQNNYSVQNSYQNQSQNQQTVNNARMQTYHKVIENLANALGTTYEKADGSVKSMAKKENNWANAKTVDAQMAICINIANQLMAEASQPAPQ